MAFRSETARGKAFVKMFEIVDASSWTYDANGGIDDLRPLLLMMDIGSCASAEKHTGVNCVTASMGDVVIEHYPKIGDLLELHACPVDVGKTSLNIAVSVMAHGAKGDSDSDSESDNEGDNDDDGKTVGSTSTLRVCEAFFTYVTTRGPEGEKRFVPPLSNEDHHHSISSETTWERTMARFRKQLIRLEQSSTQQPNGYRIPLPDAIFETSEVVLPSHQNHMEHLFGGIVMGWMYKSVKAACVRATRLPLKHFRVRSIQRVDFPTGASVSDHVFLRPRITAIFDGGRSAEVEVMVGKRNIKAQKHCDRAEVTMNVGYFYVSGISDGRSNAKKLSSKVAPFAKLLQHRIANTSSLPDDLVTMAHQRRTALLARQHLLAGIGEAIVWDPLLEAQAPILTILSALRLRDEYQKTKHRWRCLQTCQDPHQEPIWWVHGNTLGHDNTMLFYTKTTISRTKQSTADGGSSFLEDVYGTLCRDRSIWDPFTMSVRVLEQQTNSNTDENGVYWDVAEYEMKASEEAHTTFCLLKAGSYIGVDGNVNKDGVPTCGVVASRSVRHKESIATNRVLPSGFLLKTLESGNAEREFLEITYVSEVRTKATYAIVTVQSNRSCSHIFGIALERIYSTILTRFDVRKRWEQKMYRMITSFALLRRL